MTTCPHCSSDPTVNACCGPGHLHLGGRRVARARRRPPDGPCPGCDVPPGLVHMLGCPEEPCPRCDGRLSICDCLEADAVDGPLRDDAPDEGPSWPGLADATEPGERATLTGSPRAGWPEPDGPDAGWPGTDRPDVDGPRPGDASAGADTALRPALRALDGDGESDGGEPLPRPAPGVVLTPLPVTAAPERARFHEEVHAVARWALAHGRGCDRDIVALALSLLEAHRCDDGLLLARPDVDALISNRFSNMLSIARTLIPYDIPEHAWTVLMWLHDEGHIAPASDPLPQLLEPLQCDGGLDADGRPRPDGVDVDFPCQCRLPHDPTLPPGVGARIIGYDLPQRRPLVVHAHLALRSDDPPCSVLGPLLALFRRVEDEARMAPVELDLLAYSGSSSPPVGRRGSRCTTPEAAGRSSSSTTTEAAGGPVLTAAASWATGGRSAPPAPRWGPRASTPTGADSRPPTTSTTTRAPARTPAKAWAASATPTSARPPGRCPTPGPGRAGRCRWCERAGVSAPSH